MNFVDREEEQIRLKDALNGVKPSFVVVYGRRRFGKSTLIKTVLTDRDIYFLADQTEKTQQIRLLAKAVASKIEGFDKVVYPDWDTLFETLNLRTTLTEKAQKAPFTKGKAIVPTLFVKDCNTFSNNVLSAENILYNRN